MQCFLSNKTRKKAEIPREIPTPTSHIEFEKFATFSEGVILDELDRHRKEVEALSEMDEKKQKEIDDLYKKLLEKEKDAEDEKKLVKVKSPLLPNVKTGIGGRKPKISGSSKKLSNKPLSMAFQSRLPRWL